MDVPVGSSTGTLPPLRWAHAEIKSGTMIRQETPSTIR